MYQRNINHKSFQIPREGDSCVSHWQSPPPGAGDTSLQWGPGQSEFTASRINEERSDEEHHTCKADIRLAQISAETLSSIFILTHTKYAK